MNIKRFLISIKAYFGYGEFPHAYLCFQHGGSEACEKSNLRLGYQCPKCSNAPLQSVSARYKDLLERLGCLSHDGAIAEINALRQHANLEK